MKEAVFILGPESSGTKMLTDAFVRSGYFGDATFEQRLDDLQFDARPDKIVFRRSLPHGGRWPEIVELVQLMQAAGYAVRPVLIWRDKDCCVLSQIKNQGHAGRVSAQNIPAALSRAFLDLSGSGLWPHCIYYGAFVKHEAVRRSFFTDFGIEPPPMEFLDADAKYATPSPAFPPIAPYADTAYYSRLDGQNIGESIPMMSHAVEAERLGIQLYWIVDTGSDGRIHAELFRVYQRAGLFCSLVINGQRDGSPECEDGPLLSYIRRCYGRRHRTILSVCGAPGIKARATNMPGELRRRFSFLGCHDTRPYVTCQPATFLNGTRDVPASAILAELGRPLSEMQSLYILGLPADAVFCAAVESAARGAFPRASIVNLAGRTDLEGFLRVLYSSRFHVSAESCSALFTCQLGIPSVQFSHTIGEGLDPFRWAKWFVDVPTFRCAVDSI